MGVQGDTGEYRGVQAHRGYRGCGGVHRGTLDTGGTEGYRGLQGIKGDTGIYRGVQGDTEGYKYNYRGVQGDTEGYKYNYRGVQVDTFSWKGLFLNLNKLTPFNVTYNFGLVFGSKYYLYQYILCKMKLRKYG